jgi:sarcosine oxidase subunit beta
MGLDRGRTEVERVFTADGRQFAAGERLVLATNAGTADLVAPLGVALPLVSVLPQIVLTRPVRPPPTRHVIGHTSRRLAMKTLGDRRVMISGGWLGRVDPRSGRGEVVEAEIAGNVAEAVSVFPRLATARVAAAVADRFEAIAPDLLPIVDALPTDPKVVVATGWSGQGWGPVPGYLELIAAWLLGARKPDLLEPFSLHRFAR